MHIYCCCLLVDETQCLQLTNDPMTCWLFVNDEALRWSEAAQYCTQRNGFLAIEHDASLGGKIREQLKTYRRTREYWFGLRRKTDGGSFVWTNGMTSFWNGKTL